MEKKPVLVVMAAGMGSRYGGLKQIDPVGAHGEIIIDFSLYDAVKAGFSDVIFIIKHSMEQDFKEIIGDRMEKIMNVQYAYQDIDFLPEGYSVPEGREKPWGTGHAILSCKSQLAGRSFAVINADDFYGAGAFELVYSYLLEVAAQPDEGQFAMVGYILENTLTDHGHVARGVCVTDESGYLKTINERTHIERRAGGAEYTEDGESWAVIPPGSIVSMNLWGFTPRIMEALENGFRGFLDTQVKADPKKSEYFLPTVVDNMLEDGRATVKVLKSGDRWYGVTYREDKPVVVSAVRAMRENGIYPDRLWEGK